MKTKIPKVYRREEVGTITQFVDCNGEECKKECATIAIYSSSEGSFPITKKVFDELDIDVGDKVTYKVIYSTYNFEKRPKHAFDIPEETLTQIREERKDFEDWFKSRYHASEKDLKILKITTSVDEELKTEYIYNGIYVEISWETWKELSNKSKD